MISTQNYDALPDANSLKRLAKALAVLDAVNSPDLEFRYYTFNAEWSEDEQVLEMSDGEGDQMLVLFRPEGCVINGYLDGLEQPDKSQVTRGLPAAFDDFMFGEPVSSIGTSFCLWYTPGQGWQTGVVGDDDSSEELLYMLDGNPETYADWADEYYGDETERSPIDADTVAQVYRGETLTKAMVLRIVDEVEDWAQLETDLQAIGYPYDFS
ncbi:hypothetical protein GCM10023185_45080 [Hymenobacter saemangeumensis]|uniref:Uncharacterized protein n=1 Tax=Hymenobacter saemangeumensis TaxID=1084522 RepID=A0ABP8ISF2_9BACT